MVRCATRPLRPEGAKLTKCVVGAVSLFVMEPAGFQLHQFGHDRVVTHTIPVGEHTGLIPVSAEARARWTSAPPRVLLAKRDEHRPSA